MILSGLSRNQHRTPAVTKILDVREAYCQHFLVSKDGDKTDMCRVAASHWPEYSWSIAYVDRLPRPDRLGGGRLGWSVGCCCPVLMVPPRTILTPQRGNKGGE